MRAGRNRRAICGAAAREQIQIDMGSAYRVFAAVGTGSVRPIHLRLQLHELPHELRLRIGGGEWGHVGGKARWRRAEELQGLVHVEAGKPRGLSRRFELDASQANAWLSAGLAALGAL